MRDDQVADAEKIRDYGMYVAYSTFSYCKNRYSKKEDWTCTHLVWVSHVSGKRESRRVVGDYILREYDNVFRVFIHANKEARIKRILSKGLCDEKKVSDFITKRDKQRANYYNFYSNKRWDDLSNYHLTIDSSEFDIDEVAEIIITAIGKIKPPAKK